MIFLSPLLLAISLNLDTLTVSLSYGIRKIHLTKSNALLLATITSICTFLFMFIGKLLLYLFQPWIGNIFGAILLSFIGVYFIVEYMRLENNRAWYDTSFYFENSLKYKNVLENPHIIDSDKSSAINIRQCLNLSFAITLNNLFTSFAASITGVSLSLSIFLNFIITIVSIYCGYLNSRIYISKWFNKYSNLVSGIILIILGIYEAFI